MYYYRILILNNVYVGDLILERITLVYLSCNGKIQ